MKAKPMFNFLFVTADVEKLSGEGIIMTGNTIKTHQRVLAVGHNVDKNIAVDDIVAINWSAYAERDWDKKTGSDLQKDLEYNGVINIKPPLIVVDDPSIPEGSNEMLKISDRDIDYFIKADDLKELAKKAEKSIIVEEPTIVKTDKLIK